MLLGERLRLLLLEQAENARRSTRFSFRAVLAFVWVRWPLTGNPSACRLPLYEPMARWWAILARTSLRKSLSMINRWSGSSDLLSSRGLGVGPESKSRVEGAGIPSKGASSWLVGGVVGGDDNKAEIRPI